MNSETQKAVFLVVMAIIVIVAIKKPLRREPETKVIVSKKNGIVIVPAEGIAGSVKVDEWAEQNNMELRRFEDGANLADVEPWIAELYEATQGKRPAAAISIDGRLRVIPVNSKFLKTLRELK